MIFLERHSPTKATTATTADSVTWLPDELEPLKKGGAIDLLLSTTVVEFQHLTRVEVKVDGIQQMFLLPAHYSAIRRRKSRRGVIPTTATRFETYLHPGAVEFEDPAYYSAACLPPGSPMVIISKNATPGAGTMRLGWHRQTAPCRFTGHIVGETYSIGASQTREPVINRKGILRGLVVPDVTNIDELQILVGGVPTFNAEGVFLLAAREGAYGENPAAPVYWEFPDPVDLGQAVVQLRVRTGAGWTADPEWTPVCMIPR